MKFSESHEWIKLQEDVGTVGISNYAQKELGDIVYVELPTIGKTVRQGDEVAVLESTKAASDVYSPVSGIILDVNTRLTNAPEIVNNHPENEGWLFKIKLSNAKEIDELLAESDYKKKTT